MNAMADSSTKSGMTAGLMLAGAVSLLALPSAVLAFTANFEPADSSASADSAIDSMEAGAASADLSQPIPIRSLAKGTLFPFTPAETPNRPDRSITVAVRLDANTAKTISVRRIAGTADAESAASELRISPTAFNLGVARGYKNFSQGLVPAKPAQIGGINDVDKFSLSPSKAADNSRFNPRIVLDETQSGGRAPRTYGGDGDDLVDVGGSYRVTRNLDVTAGVRYSQERERLLPPITDGAQDNQAVYVGTQFRF